MAIPSLPTPPIVYSTSAPVDHTHDISVGLATKLGTLGAGISGVIAGVAAISHGAHDDVTITALLTSGALIFTVLGGRFAQAVALIRSH